MAIDDAFEKYSWQLGRERERSVLTKAEHNQRVGCFFKYKIYYFSSEQRYVAWTVFW